MVYKIASPLIPLIRNMEDMVNIGSPSSKQLSLLQRPGKMTDDEHSVIDMI